MARSACCRGAATRPKPEGRSASSLPSELPTNAPSRTRTVSPNSPITPSGKPLRIEAGDTSWQSRRHWRVVPLFGHRLRRDIERKISAYGLADLPELHPIAGLMLKE